MTRSTTEKSSKSKPVLAVVIACHNYAPFVDRAIRSVLDQGRADCELVVIDDGSTDDSWNVIVRTGATAFKIENSGQRQACLYGFDKTTAPFVLFLDADDEMQPGSIDAIIHLLDPAVAKLQFSLSLIDAEGQTLSSSFSALDSFRSGDGLAQEMLKKGVYRSPPTSGNVFRRDLVELLREATYDQILDGVILFAAPLFGDVVSTSKELGRYRVHDRNVSGLGRLPDAASLERDIDRFLLRMEHLRAVVARFRPGAELVDPHKTFYFRERKLFLDVVSGKRPGLTALPGLLSKLAREDLGTKNKAILGTFFSLAAILPSSKSKILLAYRLKAGRRSVLAFAKELLGFGGRGIAS
ncbi:glycosyltransferase family 2 protein [Bradyrhizobium sp. URHC0002]